MWLKLPETGTNKNPDWSFIDGWLDRFIEPLPQYISKRQFKIEMAKRLQMPLGYHQSVDDSRLIRRLMLRAIRTKKIRSDPQRWRMLIINKPQELTVRR